MSREPIRVLIVDDSALVREMLSEMIPADGDLEVVGTASDPLIAREKIKQLNPDVLTLDVAMPRMDGITFLRNLMRLRPTPVVMVSSLTEKGAEQTLEALALGATDFVTKPKANLAESLTAYGAEIRDKIRLAARSNLSGISRSRPREAPRLRLPSVTGHRRLIAIGASAGGTEAIRDVLVRLPAESPPVLICQHLPATFTGTFARRLDRECALSVREACDGERVLPGFAYVAPGDRHLYLSGRAGHWTCRLDPGPLVNRHRPAVDVLFRSLADLCPGLTIGVLLTGMGKDGAQGLLALRQAGAATIAQNEASSLVWGMPGEAVRLGAADQVLDLETIPEHIVGLLG